MNPNETFGYNGEMDERLMFGYDPLDVDVYVELVEVTDDVQADSAPVDAGEHYWSVGVHDRTVGSHPTIPESMGDYASIEEMTNHLLGVSMDLGATVRRYRATEEYRNTRQVEERAPPFSDSGQVEGTIPEFLIRQEQHRVLDGQKTVEDAVGDLYDEFESRTEE